MVYTTTAISEVRSWLRSTLFARLSWDWPLGNEQCAELVGEVIFVQSNICNAFLPGQTEEERICYSYCFHDLVTRDSVA